jgi:hypothetical protein
VAVYAKHEIRALGAGAGKPLPFLGLPPVRAAGGVAVLIACPEARADADPARENEVTDGC